VGQLGGLTAVFFYGSGYAIIQVKLASPKSLVSRDSLVVVVKKL
jgi:hypothetical protein